MDSETMTFPPRQRPKGLRLRTPKACWLNAALVALDHRYHHLTYAEGEALSPEGFWCDHGWVVDEDGYAIDVTWKEPGLEYRGRTYTRREVAEAVANCGKWGFGGVAAYRRGW